MAASRKDEPRELILSSARALLAERSMQGVSLSLIARRAGVSKGTIYYYFKTKEDILFALLDDYLEQQAERLNAWTENPDKDTSLPRLVKFVLEGDLASAPLRMQFLHDAMQGNEGVRQKLLARYRDFAATIAQKIARRTDKVSAEYLSWLLLITADGLMVHQSMGNSGVSAAEMIDQTQAYLKKVF